MKLILFFILFFMYNATFAQNSDVCNIVKLSVEEYKKFENRSYVYSDKVDGHFSQYSFENTYFYINRYSKNISKNTLRKLLNKSSVPTLNLRTCLTQGIFASPDSIYNLLNKLSQENGKTIFGMQLAAPIIYKGRLALMNIKSFYVPYDGGERIYFLKKENEVWKIITSYP